MQFGTQVSLAPFGPLGADRHASCSAKQKQWKNCSARQMRRNWFFHGCSESAVYYLWNQDWFSKGA